MLSIFSLNFFQSNKSLFCNEYSIALCETYLPDPANLTMKSILITNKHLLFFLSVIISIILFNGVA